MINSFKKVFDIAWTNLKRNSYLSWGATGTLALTLILFLGLLSLQFLSTQVVDSLKDKIDVSAYFKTEAQEAQILEIKSDLEKHSLVESVTYTSRDQALADFKDRHKDDELIQESLTQLDDNPLQASLNIKSKDPSRYSEITKFLEDHPSKEAIAKINFYENQGVIDRIQSISNAVGNWGLAVTLFVGLIAVLVTFNTIRLTIYNQKQEIEIMRLVGASNWYIRGPYLMEGGLYGLFAAVLALAVFYPVIYFLSDKVENFVVAVSMIGYFGANVVWVFLLTVFLGILLGVASSYITISKHLKI